MPSRSGEGTVQMAIIAALTVWCDRMNIVDLSLHAPYANQQGSQRRRYCADIVGLLGSSAVILLEVKYLPGSSKSLTAFDVEQHKECIRFEKLGVPIAYAYNGCDPLTYSQCSGRADDWPERTLREIKRSPPLSLPGEQPSVEVHGTLFDWIQGAQSEDASEALGRLHGAVESCSDLRNGVLVLLYSPDSRQLATLTPDDVLGLVRDIRDLPVLKASAKSKIERLLGASSVTVQQISENSTNRKTPKKGI